MKTIIALAATLLAVVAGLIYIRKSTNDTARRWNGQIDTWGANLGKSLDRIRHSGPISRFRDYLNATPVVEMNTDEAVEVVAAA